MSIKNLLTLGLTNTADGTSQLLLLGLEAGPELPVIGTPVYKRNANIYISKNPNATADSTNTVALKIKDFSFNRNSEITRIQRNTLDPLQERVINPFISQIGTVNFSFTTYISPILDTNVTSPEEYLWLSLMGTDTVTSNSTSSTIDFADGNVGTLQNLTLWFDQPNNSEASYRVDNAIVDRATVNFDINGIAEIQWQGRALDISVDDTPPTYTDRTAITPCLKQKLSTITMTMNTETYNLALIGGQIVFENNNTFYGRNRIGKTTTPEGHYTGNRTISGSLKFYLKTGISTSASLFNELLGSAGNDTYESTHLADIAINIAGTTAPYVKIDVPQAILELGRIDFGEVLSVNIPFIAKEEAGKYSTIVYNMP